MRNLKMFALALGLAAGACNNDSASRANRAANKLVDRTADLVDLQKRKLENATGEVKEVGERARDVTKAQLDFAAKRTARIDVLRVQHGLIALQPTMITGLASIAPLTDAGRADVNEKLELLQMRLDETGNLIQDLKTTDAQTFSAKDDEASDAMKRLVSARDAAWKALDDAPRAVRSS
jgi:hypothetical protein